MLFEETCSRLIETLGFNGPIGEIFQCSNQAECICEICQQRFCVDHMYLTCQVCHNRVTCYQCGCPVRDILKTCQRHVGQTKSGRSQTKTLYAGAN